jgi:hypothetical protein
LAVGYFIRQRDPDSKNGLEKGENADVIDGETHDPEWTRDGKLVTPGVFYDVAIWRFHPAR